MSTVAEVKVVSISPAPSLGGPDQDESWESAKEALQDAFVAGSTTELCQSELLLNQHGNTVRLIALRGNDFLFCPPMKKWFYFTGTHWATDEKGVVRTLAKDTVFQFLHQALAAKNGDAIEFAIKSLGNGPIHAMLKGAEAALAVMPRSLIAIPTHSTSPIAPSTCGPGRHVRTHPRILSLRCSATTTIRPPRVRRGTLLCSGLWAVVLAQARPPRCAQYF